MESAVLRLGLIEIKLEWFRSCETVVALHSAVCVRVWVSHISSTS